MSEERVETIVSYIEEMKSDEHEYAVWLGALMCIKPWSYHAREIKAAWVAYFRAGWEPTPLDIEMVATMRYRYRKQLDELNRPLTSFDDIDLGGEDDIPF